MDGVYNGKPYEQMDDLRVLLFSETSICSDSMPQVLGGEVPSRQESPGKPARGSFVPLKTEAFGELPEGFGQCPLQPVGGRKLKKWCKKTLHTFIR